MKKLELERLLFIEATLLIKGQTNRNDLAVQYGTSIKTATRSLNQYKECCPDQMHMERSQYLKTKTCQPCLFQDIKQARKFLDAINVINELIDKIQDDIEE